MNGAPAIGASAIRGRLEQDLSTPGEYEGRDPAATEKLVRALLADRRRFGITRVGSLTRLDRAGVAVAQAVRPLALSNTTSQGKGASLMEAAASALMEALESWAAERIPAARITTARARDLGEEVRHLYSGSLVHSFDAGWDQLPLQWIEAYDLFAARVVPVPLAMVDTVYTFPSPHPVAFARSTSGLAAGTSLLAAFIHAALELLERAGVATSERRRHSLGALQIDPASVRGRRSSVVLARLKAAELLAGIWSIPAEHSLPTFHCHVIEDGGHREIAPLPGEGFGCDFTSDRALAKALMEAAQARVSALAGAREDITRGSYPDIYDRNELAAWRRRLASPRNAIAFSECARYPESGRTALELILRALKDAGAKAVLVVSLFSSPSMSLEVVRVVASPLRDLIRA